MRIGMMADTYKPHISGITNYIELNKKYLEKAGHEVYIFTFGDEDYPDDESNVIRSPGLPLVDTGYYLSFRYTRKAKALLQTMDIVHVHHPFLSGRLALRYCRPLEIPIVFTNHTRYDLYAQVYLPALPENISLSLLETYMPDFCAAVDMVISPSPGMANVLRKLKVEAPITIVPNGVEIQRFQQPAPPDMRQKLGFTDKDILLIYVGRLAPEKNLPFLLQAFLGVAETLQNAHLLLIGDGPSREELQTLLKKSPQSHQVHFFGRIDYDLLPQYLAASDLFVTASVSEVHPLSVIEAMAAGLPVLGIHSAGVGDTVLDGRTGLLSSENLPAFTAKMTQLCLDPTLRRSLGQHARQQAEHYAIERTTQIMLQHYENLIYNARRRRGLRHQLRNIMERFTQ